MSQNSRPGLSYAQAGVDVDKGNALVDAIAGRPLSEVYAWYQTLNQQERRGFLFVASRVLDYDSFMAILTHCVIETKNAEYAATLEQAAADKTRALKDELASANRNLDRLQDKCNDLQTRIAQLDAAKDRLHAQVAAHEITLEHLRKKEQKLDTLRSACLALLNE